MRTFLSLVLFLQIAFVGVCFGEDKLSDIKLIRRAYIDMLGVLPTVTEVEWYTVYNRNGYEMAVNYLVERSKKLTKEQLLASEYKQNGSRLLSIEEVMCIFVYLSGKKAGIISYTQAKQNLANYAIISSSSDSEIIEYICNALLCRDSSLKEVNLIEQHLKASTSDNEKDKWLSVIDLIITFDAFTHK